MSADWLRELRAAATPGPWAWRDFRESFGQIEKRSLVSESAFYEEYKGVNKGVVRLEPRWRMDLERPFWHGEQADLDLIALAPELAELCADMFDDLAVLTAELGVGALMDIQLSANVRAYRARLNALKAAHSGEDSKATEGSK